ncbi:hypothetical protein AS032_32585 [Rhodococcus qingshengii]|nr:hypothetical protein AOT96_30660 [Rhodococcus sp. 008]ARE37681.1 hypothetical protein A0W34_29490 [Rhodococcus sp. BH4]KDQ04983.1 hypothetical protein EN35_17735 [Rhodococcus qingshengii]KSU65416.1 hypothetical protein AS032_32585 [Rhodococcus qingshengii]KZF15151.1 hypothetical protein A2J01_32275 [Rhodococcus sp. EPR-134]
MSAILRAVSREEPHEPFLSRLSDNRWRGVGVLVELWPWTSMIESLMSISTRPPSPAVRAISASPQRNRDATASSWRACPKANLRRHEPDVEGA